MTKNEVKNEPMEDIVIHTSNGIQNISAEEFPTIISKSLAMIDDIDSRYKAASKSVADSKREVNAIASKANSAKASAQEVMSKAEDIDELKAGVFHRKKTIEALQEGMVDSAKMQINMADTVMQITNVQGSMVKAQSETMDALKLTFDFDKEIANVTKYLFLLGCSSIAASQSVCRTLELKLKNASEEELSEYARQELENVVKNLKAQESMMQRQKQTQEDLDMVISVINDNKEKLKLHDEKIEEQGTLIAEGIQKDVEYNQRLHFREEKDAEQDKKLEEVVAKEAEHDRRLDVGDRKDIEQDERLAAGDKKDEEQDERLAAGDKKDEEQDERLAAGDKKDEEQDERLAAGDRKDIEQDERLAAGDRKDIEQDERLAAGDKKDKEQDELLVELQSQLSEANLNINNLTESLEILKTKLDTRSSKIGLYGAYASGIIGVILAIISIVL